MATSSCICLMGIKLAFGGEIFKHGPGGNTPCYAFFGGTEGGGAGRKRSGREMIFATSHWGIEVEHLYLKRVLFAPLYGSREDKTHGPTIAPPHKSLPKLGS